MHRDDLAKWGFGGEWPSYAGGLSIEEPDDSAIQLWNSYSFAMDKEVFCAAKAEWFAAKGFKIVCVKRRIDGVFPPSRHRVMGFYDAWAHAFGITGPLLQRCHQAYEHQWDMLEKFPTLHYEDMLAYDPAYLAGVLGTGEQQAQAICEKMQRTWKPNNTEKGFKNYA